MQEQPTDASPEVGTVPAPDDRAIGDGDADAAGALHMMSPEAVRD